MKSDEVEVGNLSHVHHTQGEGCGTWLPYFKLSFDENLDPEIKALYLAMVFVMVSNKGEM